MKIIQTRKWFENDRTISELKVPGIKETLFVCEDTVRGDGDPKTVSQWKKKGITAIPYGTYEIIWTSSAKYPQGTLQLKNVPGYEGIRVHSGNNETHTEGCLLPGKTYTLGKGVFSSKDALTMIEKVVKPLLGKEKIEWEIKSNV